MKKQEIKDTIAGLKERISELEDLLNPDNNVKEDHYYITVRKNDGYIEYSFYLVKKISKNEKAETKKTYCDIVTITICDKNCYDTYSLRSISYQQELLIKHTSLYLLDKPIEIKKEDYLNALNKYYEFNKLFQDVANDFENKFLK